MKNSLGVEVTKPDNVLIIMRGVPGSGKSTIAKKIVKNGAIHSTDDVIEANYDYYEFFENLKETNNYLMLRKMHSINFMNAKLDMDRGVSPIIIDNTNIRPSKAKKYVEYALSIGYSDDNIKFIEVGTGGLTEEELAKRNTHGVPLNKIKSLIQSMKSIGELTLEKVLNSKSIDELPKLFASVVLDEPSRQKLITNLKHFVPNDWEIIAHHMTINYGKGIGEDRKEDKGKIVNLVATGIGISDMAIAVKVDGYSSDNEIPHITIAINKKEGAEPKMSNDIINWQELTEHIPLKGKIEEVKLNK